ncbi:hypothetical protein ASF83_12705 [Plantibacter sp. Leaf171]|uniref:hypothetical protein n=1 Tax=unclassified Plantibacter TaxID=2624265 RepID=UPI0006FF1223|nr:MULTISPECIES: hypothetical protein [unclassified Plantibacter]KQM16641.1 hypothetical protein ASE44_12720 [Plantibacter sp. Leaf1]KQQ52752.1 hypothetical protein ASF68_10760 [Plantibacter sp. Leaf314]KQR59776.1 hypothetical protein ASF83_12705 [Plantibacter sp. Leaf171]
MAEHTPSRAQSSELIGLALLVPFGLWLGYRGVKGLRRSASRADGQAADRSCGRPPDPAGVVGDGSTDPSG